MTNNLLSWVLVTLGVVATMVVVITTQVSMAETIVSLRSQLTASKLEVESLKGRPITESEHTCVRGRYLTAGGVLGGTVAIGEVQICGGNLFWTTVYGPNLTTMIENRDREIEVLKTMLKDAGK